MVVAENVTDVRARVNEQLAAALPHAERHFQVLTAPYLHSLTFAKVKNTSNSISVEPSR